MTLRELEITKDTLYLAMEGARVQFDLSKRQYTLENAYAPRPVVTSITSEMRLRNSDRGAAKDARDADQDRITAWWEATPERKAVRIAYRSTKARLGAATRKYMQAFDRWEEALNAHSSPPVYTPATPSYTQPTGHPYRVHVEEPPTKRILLGVLDRPARAGEEKCMACEDHVVCMVIKPCDHRIYCYDCANKHVDIGHTTCPLCRAGIEKWMALA